ncbi:MAG: thioredoxin domain-containing protein, partial [Planctomycetes bacterium]|nr:thioredoxin domain-containing protein [Planctomycetota bacterium]
YSTCHWCHVMEHESFENEEIAALLNREFVCIKLDREERPDVDSVYMKAVQAFSRRGGWPASLFLTPDRVAFYAGTYFPPEHFKKLSEQVAELWKTKPEALRDDAARTLAFIKDAYAMKASKDLPPASLALAAAERFIEGHDAKLGGFTPAPKFPRTSVHELLVSLAATGEVEAAAAPALFSLLAMSRGGIRDHVGGGFHRYSTDERWLVPHFEKMLYDQALIANTYLEAGLFAADEHLLGVARDTLDTMLRDFRGDHGAFLVGYDADSGGIEGSFYVWTRDSIEKLLPEAQSAVVIARFAVPKEGNFDEIPGHCVLAIRDDWAGVAGSLEIEVAEARRLWSLARETMRKARNDRVAPRLDDKVLTAWNGMAITALVRASRALDEPRYLAAAESAMTFLAESMTNAEGRLFRRFRGGDLRFDATLEDQAWAGLAAQEMFLATREVKWLAFAEARSKDLLSWHQAKDGALLEARHDADDLITRLIDAYDGATPSGLSVALRFLTVQHALTGQAELRTALDAALRAIGTGLAISPEAYPYLLTSVRTRHLGLREVVIVGDPDDPTRQAMQRHLDRQRLPGTLVMVADDHEAAALEKKIPLLAQRRSQDGTARAWVCRDGVCLDPASDLEAFRA